jgi:hypothetical protein
MRTVLFLLWIVSAAGCSRSEPSPPPALAPTDLPTALPAAVDLRPTLLRLGLGPRAQGPRPTCSIFTACAALEFAIASARGHAEPMSVEFLNWAGNAATGRSDDGDFFHYALAGYAKYGLCAETAWPYATAFDGAARPSAEALAAADAERAELASRVHVVWIRPWQADSKGLDDAQFVAVKRVLAAGFPVAAGASHSRLLVGYRDDAASPGGGVFATKDSGLGAWGEVDYAFVKNEVGDAFWVDAWR